MSRNLASKGANVLLNYTSESSSSRTRQLAQELQSQYGIKAVACQADMGTETGPAQIISTAKNNFSNLETGRLQIDIIVQNAAVAGNQSIADVSPSEFHRQYAVNVLGPLLLMQAAQPHLPSDRSGRVVNLSSVSSSLGFRQQSIYGGSKAALEAMTRTWARELCESCTVNAVNPGPVATDMYGATTEDFQRQMARWTRNAPLAKVRPGVDREEFVINEEKAGGRPAYEEEIAGVVGMLCSAESGWCTGSVVCANGGFRMSI